MDEELLWFIIGVIIAIIVMIAVVVIVGNLKPFWEWKVI